MTALSMNDWSISDMLATVFVVVTVVVVVVSFVFLRFRV